jgi:hypothetical protein
MIFVLMACQAASIIAQPKQKIAVLDAIIEEGVDTSARVPVTEKIIEALVVSGKFAVLDRSNIQQVLDEKKFQLSGLVQDSEIKQAGVYLGADLVCVAKVSKLGRTYFVSGKIIDVITGQIEAQTSQEQQGEIDVVLSLARNIGAALAGGVVEPIPAQVLDEPKPVRETEPEPIDTPETPSDRSEPRSRIVASYLLPAFIGSGADMLDDYVELVLLPEGYDYAYDTRTAGISVQMLQPLFSLFYASVSVAFLSRSDYSEFFYFFAENPDDYNVYYNILDLSAAAGIVYPIMPNIQAYGGIGTGLLVFSLSEALWPLENLPDPEGNLRILPRGRYRYRHSESIRAQCRINDEDSRVRRRERDRPVGFRGINGLLCVRPRRRVCVLIWPE